MENNQEHSELWQEFITNGLCGLCGNSGVIVTTGLRSSAGYPCGTIKYCICPNGRKMKELDPEGAETHANQRNGWKYMNLKEIQVRDECINIILANEHKTAQDIVRLIRLRFPDEGSPEYDGNSILHKDELDRTEFEMKQKKEDLMKQRRFENLEFQDGELHSFVKDHEQRISICFPGTAVQRAERICEHYHTKALRSMSTTQMFQQDLLTNIRALSLVANSVGSASTHGEKNARLRGLIEILEGAYTKVSNWKIEMQSSQPPWAYDSIFQADYPARHYIRRIEELEYALAQATQKPVTHKIGEPEQEEDPFSKE